jgi:hypothetical protein
VALSCTLDLNSEVTGQYFGDEYIEAATGSFQVITDHSRRQDVTGFFLGILNGKNQSGIKALRRAVIGEKLCYLDGGVSAITKEPGRIDGQDFWNVLCVLEHL